MEKNASHGVNGVNGVLRCCFGWKHATFGRRSGRWRNFSPRGALVIALPMKIEGGSGGPLLAIALLPR
jgi:hypothetical protein